MHNPRSECLSRTIYIIVSSVKKNGTRFIICVLKWRPTLILHRKKYICFPTPLYIISSRLFDSHVSISITIIESYFNTNRRSNCWNYDLNETCNGSSPNYQRVDSRQIRNTNQSIQKESKFIRTKSITKHCCREIRNIPALQNKWDIPHIRYSN